MWSLIVSTVSLLLLTSYLIAAAAGVTFLLTELSLIILATTAGLITLLSMFNLYLSKNEEEPKKNLQVEKKPKITRDNILEQKTTLPSNQLQEINLKLRPLVLLDKELDKIINIINETKSTWTGVSTRTMVARAIGLNNHQKLNLEKIKSFILDNLEQENNMFLFQKILQGSCKNQQEGEQRNKFQSVMTEIENILSKDKLENINLSNPEIQNTKIKDEYEKIRHSMGSKVNAAQSSAPSIRRNSI